MCNTSGEPLCSTTMAFIIYINVPFNHHMTECHPVSIRLICASQFCLKLLEAVTQQAQIACLQQLAGTVQHLLGGCILFSEQVQFGQPEVNLDMQVRCCYERSLCTCLFKQEDSSLQIAPSLS